MENLTKNIIKAMDMAAQLHVGQERKGNGTPYIVHPFKVAWILNQYTNNEAVVMAGLLHDTLEDCKYSLEQLEKDFGQEVADIVVGVTEDISLKETQGSKDSWLERKEKYLDHLKTASSGSLMVCAADKIDNLNSMIISYQEKGDALWDEFNSPPDKKLWFYEQVIITVEGKINDDLFTLLKKTYDETARVIVQKV